MPIKRNKKAIGAEGERVAAEFLLGKGYNLLERNYRNRLGELDIIADKGDTLVFVEVKTRMGTGYGRPGASVDWRKQKKNNHDGPSVCSG